MVGFKNLFSKNKNATQADKKIKAKAAPAAKPSLPNSTLMQIDPNTDLRLLLASRLTALFPAQSGQDVARLYAFVVQSLGTFALDEILKIRLALSTALKDYAFAPPKTVGDLMRDVERDVSEPILRFCAGLSDADLLDILRLHPAHWVLRAINEQGRDKISPSMSPDGDHTMSAEEIVLMAKEVSEWHEHKGAAPQMPAPVAAEMAEFINGAVSEILRGKGRFDTHTTQDVMHAFRRRMNLIDAHTKNTSSIPERIEMMLKQGGLSDDTIIDGLAVRDFDFVIGVVAFMADTQVSVIENVISARAPSPVVALCWKAGLSMRTALLLQQDLAQVSPKRLIYPKDGTDFPFSERAMIDQLAFLGVFPPKKS